MNQLTQQVNEVRQTLSHLKGKLSATLPKGQEFDRFARHVILCIESDPNLLTADRNSLYTAISRASASGLVPDGREGTFVRFKNSVVWMPMVGGLLKLVRQSGELKSLSANVVREGDEFDYWLDDEGEHIKHRPKIGSTQPVVAAYALATTIHGGTYAEVMSADEVDKVRCSSRSGAKNQGPWGEWFDEMVKKTAIRRLSKKLPMSATDSRLIAQVETVDELYDFGKPKAVEEKPQANTGRPRVFDAVTQEGESQ